jgi:hypothetical protein
MKPEAEKVPVTLITGFLGAGMEAPKTMLAGHSSFNVYL